MDEDVTAAARAAMEDRDWERLRLLLHPYLHWTDRDGSTTRGRRNVLAKLAASPAAPPPPASVELRDHQIYRWRA